MISFSTLLTAERVDARREVEEWAEELLDDQQQTWLALKRAKKPCKPRPATREECFEKSREIRVKRERNETYWNQLTSEHPVH